MSDNQLWQGRGQIVEIIDPEDMRLIGNVPPFKIADESAYPTKESIDAALEEPPVLYRILIEPLSGEDE